MRVPVRRPVRGSQFGRVNRDDERRASAPVGGVAVRPDAAAQASADVRRGGVFLAILAILVALGLALMDLSDGQAFLVIAVVTFLAMWGHPRAPRRAFEGVSAATQIIGAVLDGALHGIEVVETIDGDDAAVLMFNAQVARHAGGADGLLDVRSDPSGHIADLTVFLRPLPALGALADEMGRRLAGPRPG